MNETTGFHLAHVSTEPADRVVGAIESGRSLTFNVGKKTAQGTFALAIAYASKDDRAAMGQAMYAKWLANGTYRPIVNDILDSGLVSASALHYVRSMSGVGESGPVSRETLVRLCHAVKAEIDAKQAKAEAKGNTFNQPKGKKGFVYGIVCAIVREAATQPETIEAE